MKLLLKPTPAHLTLLAALLLTAFGLDAIETARGESQFNRQLVFFVIALGGMLATASIHYKRLSEWAVPLGLLTLLLLAFILLPFISNSIVPFSKGARRWINLGFVQFQPSEVAKVVYVVALADYLKFRQNYRTFSGLLIPLFITFIPMGLILMEPDLGTSLILLPVLFAMLLAAGAKIKHLLLIVTIGLLSMPLMYPLLQPYQQARIRDVLARITGDVRYEQTISHQGATAVKLIGAGGLTGHDRERARDLVRLNRLPEPHNDMVFAVVCTRWGLLGGAVVVVLYGVLIGSAFLVASLNRDPFGRLLVVGVAAIMCTQAFINIGMTAGLLPITGITLPLMSAGGTSLLVKYAMIGLVLNVAVRRPVIARPSFEFGSSGR